MKLPKTVIIAGREYRVRKDPKYAGGYFGFKDYEITIGTKCPKDTANIFLHECLEAICAERGYRYHPHSNPQSTEYRFFMNHYEFESAVVDLALALKDVLKA